MRRSGTSMWRTSADTPVTTDPAYRPAQGPYEVMTFADMRLRKSNGGTTPVLVRAPHMPSGIDAHRPMVVFSHGAGGDSSAFGYLCQYWASHGYIAVNPTHSDSVRARRARGETWTPGQDLATQVVRGVNLIDRADDIRTVLNSVERLNQALRRQGTNAQIDPKRLAMAGHSAGALTTQLMAGVRFYLRGRRIPVSAPESRFQAFILISGQGLSRPAFREDSWQDITRPMLVIAGSEDRSQVNDETPEGRTHPYRYAPSGGKHLVYIIGATHSSYAGRAVSVLLGETPSARIDYITHVVSTCTIAFLDAYLLSTRTAQDWLHSDKPVRMEGGRLRYAYK